MRTIYCSSEFFESCVDSERVQAISPAWNVCEMAEGGPEVVEGLSACGLAVFLVMDRDPLLKEGEALWRNVSDCHVLVISNTVGETDQQYPVHTIPKRFYYQHLYWPRDAAQLAYSLFHACEYLVLKHQSLSQHSKRATESSTPEVYDKNAREHINSSKLSRTIKQLTTIGKALATERDHDKLLKIILDRSKEIVSADAGSIYVVGKDDQGEKCLFFQASSLLITDHPGGLHIPLNKKSISGYVAILGKSLNIEDVYQIAPDCDYSFNRDFDKKHDYKTQSMLVVPMLNQQNTVIGVLQLINKQVADQVIPFNEYDAELLESIAGQAAVAIENNILYQSIERLFEGFVKASVTAIESRDPVTSGHSERVAIYTTEMAKKVDQLNTGVWKGVRFSKEQIKELRYASLLHDFGKVGVREKVLVKPSKLYPEVLKLIQMRFNFIKRSLQYESAEKKLKYLLEQERHVALESIQREDTVLKQEITKLDEILRTVMRINHSFSYDEQTIPFIQSLVGLSYTDFEGSACPYLEESERICLEIAVGTLTQEERLEIESHVTHSFHFLSQIPWTSSLKDIPDIAYAHHEKLDGSGYPRRMNAGQIPLQARIMTVADIYDALVASDRPYKKALPMNIALDILKLEASRGAIDMDLVNLFIETEIYKIAETMN